MIELPIPFSTPMVQALLEGRKTQTRRAIKGLHPDCASVRKVSNGIDWKFDDKFGRLTQATRCKFGQPGDRLWVKEAIRRGYCGDMSMSVYVADGFPTKADAWPWKLKTLPPMFCPRRLSRITLEVTGVRVERLQDISTDDVFAEGTQCRHDVGQSEYDRCDASPQDRYAELWESINGDGAWDENPWVWVVEFQKTK